MMDLQVKREIKLKFNMKFYYIKFCAVVMCVVFCSCRPKDHSVQPGTDEAAQSLERTENLGIFVRGEAVAEPCVIRLNGEPLFRFPKGGMIVRNVGWPLAVGENEISIQWDDGIASQVKVERYQPFVDRTETDSEKIQLVLSDGRAVGKFSVASIIHLPPGVRPGPVREEIVPVLQKWLVTFLSHQMQGDIAAALKMLEMKGDIGLEEFSPGFAPGLEQVESVSDASEILFVAGRSSLLLYRKTARSGEVPLLCSFKNKGVNYQMSFVRFFFAEDGAVFLHSPSGLFTKVLFTAP